MSAPAPTPPVCALCRKRPGVTRLPPSALLLGERWHCDADRCVRLATSGRKVYLADAEPARPLCPSCGAVLTEDSDGNCLVCGAPAHNPGARVVATGVGR